MRTFSRHYAEKYTLNGNETDIWNNNNYEDTRTETIF